jgi:hypothetical protein
MIQIWAATASQLSAPDAASGESAMRLPRVRFSVRPLMIAVFFVAIAFGGTRWVIEMKKLSARYQHLSQRYEISEHLHSDPAFGPPSDVDRE